MSPIKVTEVKTTLAGERKEFDCELLTRAGGEATVIYRMPRDVLLEDVLLRKDSISLGYFWEQRPYNVYHWIDARQASVALYFNICDNTRITRDTIEWRDLAVDVLITPDGRCRVLDEAELPAGIDAALLRHINSTRDELCREPLSRLAEYDKLTRSLINRG